MNKFMLKVAAVAAVLTPAAAFAEGEGTSNLTVLQEAVTTGTGMGQTIITTVLGFFAVGLAVGFIRKARRSA